MRSSIFAAAMTPYARHTLHGLVALTLIAFAGPCAASDWQYGCRGSLPSGDAPIIIFTRASLVMLPKAWVKGPLLGSVSDRLLSSRFRATNNNSGLVPTMVFTLEDEPDKKLTLTEISSKTISDVHRRAGGMPRNEQITAYRKVYRWVSESIYEGPYDIEMDCINYELSAPIR